MNKRRLLILFALIFLFIVPTTDFKVMAKTTRSKTKNTVKKTASVKKNTKKSTKSTKKKTSRSSTKRGVAYSRGSGAVLGKGDTERILNYAKKFLGVKYVYGSSSSKSFDCSGFTMYVFKSLGINLPHSASEQSKKGLAVSKDNLKVGDLVFFETSNRGISHVGIYIGSNKFIHASSGAGHVVITSLSDTYYASRYRGATRIVN